jgi:hypothetical protein
MRLAAHGLDSIWVRFALCLFDAGRQPKGAYVTFV